MLIEFSSEDEVNNVLQSCSSHHKDIDVMAVKSPFLWFRAASGKKQKLTETNQNLLINNGNDNMDEDILFEDLLKCESVSDQIQMLYDRTALNDLGVRLRYMVARQVNIYFFSVSCYIPHTVQ